MTPVYLYARVKLKYGQLPAFNATMAELRPLVEKRGWKLVGAWSTVIGDINEVHDIWEIADANAVGSVLTATAAEPDFRAVAARLPEQVDEEVLTVLTKTLYSP
jgi:hypothetical protein